MAADQIKRNAQEVCVCARVHDVETRQVELTESGSLMDTCSEKRTLGGFVRRRAFLAALMKADLGD